MHASAVFYLHYLCIYILIIVLIKSFHELFCSMYLKTSTVYTSGLVLFLLSFSLSTPPHMFPSLSSSLSELSLTLSASRSLCSPWFALSLLKWFDAFNHVQLQSVHETGDLAVNVVRRQRVE